MSVSSGCRSLSSHRRSAATSTSLCLLLRRPTEMTTSPVLQSGTTSAVVERRPDTLLDRRASPSSLRVLLFLRLSKVLYPHNRGHEFYPLGAELLGPVSTPSSHPTSHLLHITNHKGQPWFQCRYLVSGT